MELKEGMYVRTKEGLIDKVIIDYKGCCNSINCNCKHVSCKHNYYDEEIIIKASDNIIDLIEIGDYVNGYLVTGFDYQYSSNKKVVFSNVRLDGTGIKIPAKDIKSVVTKEQFESIKYEVE